MVDNPRPEKVAVVDEVRTRLSDSPSVVITEYRGLSVADLSELRRKLRPVGGSYKVFKNTLARRAADELDLDINEYLVGPTALVFTETTPEGDPGDVVEVAKVIKEFADGHDNLVIKGGVYEGAPVDAAVVSKLASVEPREVLLAKLAGAMAAPMQQFAGLLAAVPRNFAYALQALIDEGGAPGAPADAAAPDTNAEAEAPAEDGDDAASAAPAAETDAPAEAPAADDAADTAATEAEAAAAPADATADESPAASSDDAAE